MRHRYTNLYVAFTLILLGCFLVMAYIMFAPDQSTGQLQLLQQRQVELDLLMDTTGHMP